MEHKNVANNKKKIVECKKGSSSSYVLNIDGFNTEAFIDEVKECPAIWNYKSEFYNNKADRTSLWKSIAENIFEDFPEKSDEEKEEITAFLHKRWKGIRDSFTRYLFKARKSKEKGLEAPRAYTYFHKLKFLLSVSDSRPGCLNYENAIENLDSSENETDSLRKRKVAYGDEFIEKLSTTIACQVTETIQNSEYDENRQFLLSLTTDFRAISDEYRLDARLEMMEILRKYRNLTEQSRINPSIFFKGDKIIGVD